MSEENGTSDKIVDAINRLQTQMLENVKSTQKVNRELQVIRMYLAAKLSVAELASANEKLDRMTKSLPRINMKDSDVFQVGGCSK